MAEDPYFNKFKRDYVNIGVGGLIQYEDVYKRQVEEHPDALFVFGNAPTALMELCDLSLIHI